MIAIIDYGVCNVGSIENMLKKIGVEDVRIVTTPKEIHAADHLILPGVGSFDSGIMSLEEMDLVDSIKEFASSGKAVLGICLGMQLLGWRSEEGTLQGLGLVPMVCKKFCFSYPVDKEVGIKLKIPHMGWDRVVFHNRSSRLLDGIESPQRYYFVHSYHAVCSEQTYELMSCDYGYSFSAAVQNGNVYGCQFHPEKSHGYGMRLLKNFVEKC